MILLLIEALIHGNMTHLQHLCLIYSFPLIPDTVQYCDWYASLDALEKHWTQGRDANTPCDE